MFLWYTAVITVYVYYFPCRDVCFSFIYEVIRGINVGLKTIKVFKKRCFGALKLSLYYMAGLLFSLLSCILPPF